MPNLIFPLLQTVIGKNKASQIRGYALAILIVALATSIKLLLTPLIAAESPFLLYFGAVMLSSLYGNWRAGILATILSAFLSDYFFLNPTHALLPGNFGQILRLGIFICEGLLISGIISALQSKTQQLRLNQQIIRDKEERYRLLVDAVEDYAIYMLDLNGYIVSWNKGAERLKGYQAHEIIGQHFSCFYPEEEIEQRLPELALQQAAANGRVENEAWRIRKDGSRFCVHEVITALRDKAGNLQGFSKLSHDITERQRATEQLANLNTILEQRVKERTAQLEQAKNDTQLALNRLNSIIESTKDIIAALDLEFRFIAFNTAYKEEFTKVFGREPELGISILDPVAHLPQEQAKIRSVWGRALQGDSYIIIEDFGDPNLERNYYEINFNPIKNENNQLIGAAQIVRNVSDRIRNETEIRNLTQELEQRVIERTQALEAEIQQRIKIEANLRESEEKFRATFNQAAVGLAHSTIDGKYQLINQKLCDILGYTEAELIKLSVADITYPEDLAADTENVQRILANEIQSFSMEKRYVRQDGSIVWGNLTVSVVREANGEPKYLIGVVEDISKRKQIEIALQQSNAILNAINTTTPTMIYAKDLTGRILSANPAVLAALDKSKEEIIGKTDAEFLPNFEQAEYIRANDRQVMETGEIQVYEETLDFPIGKRTYLSTKSPYRDKEGNIIGLIGISTDISERKQFEETLQAKNHEITTIFESISDAVAIVDTQWRYIYVNDKAENLLHKTNSELIGNNMWEIFPHALDLPGYGYCHQAMAEQLTVEYEEYHPNLDKWLGVRLYPSTEGLAIYFRDVTARKQAEIALKLSEAKFRRLADANVVGIIVANYTGEIVEANEAFLQMLGYKRLDLDTAEVNWRNITPPEYFPQDAEKWQELQQTGKVSFEKEYLHKNGNRIPVFIAAAHLEANEEAAICMVVDLTERKQAENALRQSEEQFRNLANSMPHIVWTANPDGIVDYYNQRVDEFIGFSQQAEGNWQWEPVLHPDDEQRTVKAWLQAIKTGEIYECEHRVKRLDGEFRWYLSRAMPIRDEQGRITKWYGTATDIHTQKQYQAEREELLRREQLARTEAESASRMKDEFLATLSHELRTPMNAMLGWTSMLRTRKLNETATDRALETIERNTKTLNQLIEDILDVSRIIRGKIRLNLQQIQLLPVIEHAIEIVKPTTVPKDIQILVESLQGKSLQVMGDSSRLQQIVWNLLSNAIKFTPKGGCVTVKLSAIAESLGAEEIGGDNEEKEAEIIIQNPKSKIQNYYAQIQVTDTGIGIAPEFLPHVFDRFRQADGSITRSHGGLGLGLAIVRHLVELHGGTVQVHSLGVGQGATFSVNLPLVVESSTAGEQENTGEDGIPSYSDSSILKDFQVLVVDDEPDVRDLMTVILEDRGAKVTTVGSAKEALAALQKLQLNIIVSDIGMPEEDGYSLIRQIRKLPPEAGGQIPAIALTAYASAEDRNAAIAAGFNRHIAKPIDSTELTLAIAHLVNSGLGARG